MLPIVGRYKERGLVFVAINIDDDPPHKSESDPARLSQARKEQASQIREKLRRWLRENRVEAGGPSTLTIALDPDNSVGMAYQLQYIPTTIVIDRQGKIHNQWIGRVSDFESNLSRQIEALLSGPPR
jgi:thiol-disulfide isomerase/thioredoxin